MRSSPVRVGAMSMSFCMSVLVASGLQRNRFTQFTQLKLAQKQQQKTPPSIILSIEEWNSSEILMNFSRAELNELPYFNQLQFRLEFMTPAMFRDLLVNHLWVTQRHDLVAPSWMVR